MPRRTQGPPPPRRYDWSTWADGDWWELDHGTDYTVTTRNFLAVGHMWATRNGYNLSTSKTARGCKIRFTPIRTEQP